MKRTLAAVVLLAGTSSGFAGTINVEPNCSLVNAILSSNQNKPVGGCTAGRGTDTIVLPLGSTFTYSKPYGNTRNALPALSDDTIILGNASTIRRPESLSRYRIFQINPSVEYVQLYGLTIEGGYASGTQPNGGGISNGAGILILEDVALIGNIADGSGGAIYQNSAVAPEAWDLEMYRVTMYNNHADVSGGAIYVQNDWSNLHVENSTFSYNDADEGYADLAANGAYVTFIFNTVVTHGVNDGDVIPQYSLVFGPDDDLIGIDGLARYNGGLTPTHAIDPSLTDNITEGTCYAGEDQRGMPRPIDGNLDGGLACDLGSYEYYPDPDIYYCGGFQATIVGTDGDDILVGTPQPDVIQARAGHDVIRGLRGNDIICASFGDDVVYAGDGADHVYGGLNNDRLFGERSADRLIGADGRDTCNGGPETDTQSRCEVVSQIP